MNPSRLEAFSDGVFAIAITLLVLDIHVPDPTETASLAAAVSFLTIGIVWINHHAMIRRLRRVDHEVLVLNLLLLLFVGLLPFTTALMAAYLKEGAGDHLAAAIYSGSFLVMSIAFASLNGRILLRKTDLIGEGLPETRRRVILTRAVAGLVPYLLATILAVFSAYVTLAICAAVAVFYALPMASGREGRASTA